MNNNKRLRPIISLVCAVALLLSVINIPAAAAGTNRVTAATDATVAQGNSSMCYVNIDSTDNLAAIDVTVHFDPAKVKILDVFNSIGCTLYDSVLNDTSIQFRYLLDGTGSSDLCLFYFSYQVLPDAAPGNAYFDVTIGEAYDKDLNDVAISGSRCRFTISGTEAAKSCSVYSSEQMSTTVGQEFSLTYRLSTNEITSGSVVISYDPELFEVADVRMEEFLREKVVDINTDPVGAVYISFVGTQYSESGDFVTVSFRTVKNATANAQIVFRATEFCDRELNSVSCSPYTTNVSVVYDNAYLGNAPKMWLDGTFSYENKQITLLVSLEAGSHLGAGDFVITFDPELMSYNSCTKEFAPTFFLVNDKKVAEGQFRFSIVSTTDIVAEEHVLTLVFDVAHPYACQTADFVLEGTGITDSMTERISLNFIDDSVWLEYLVTFLDADGTVLQSDLYHYGDTVQVPAAPVKESDAYGTYTFAGWDKPVTVCTADAVYTATYDLKYTEYTVIFQNWDGTELSRKTYHYNDPVEIPENPQKMPDRNYCYSFVGWDAEVVPCAGDAIYTAVFEANEHIPVIDEDVPASCEDAGLTEGAHCEVCGITLIAQYEIPAKGHEMGSPVFTWSEGCSSCVLTLSCSRENCGKTESHDCEITGEAFTAANCQEQSYVDYTATYGIYSDTQRVMGAFGPHDWAEATCAAPKTCKLCAVTEGETLKHIFTNYISNQDATCEKDGTKTAVCDREGCEVTDTVTDEGSRKSHFDSETDTDHICDTCDEVLSSCVDNDGDNICDSCGEIICEHEDKAEPWHICDKCEKKISNCLDEGKDHSCDICGNAVGEHKAGNHKHTCDYCGGKVSDCTDNDRDHACDVCGAAMGDHAAGEGKHSCDYCGQQVTSCADENRDHSCDICGEAVGEHKAGSNTHTCDYCGGKVSDCMDSNTDHVCDVCGAAMGTHAAGAGKHTCDYCGQEVSSCADENKDYICDICGKELERPEEPADPTLSGVIRIAGADRIGTSLQLADQLKATLGVDKFSSVIVASALNFPDALTGSYLAAVKSAPILLTYDAAHAQVRSYIQANLAPGGMVYILGGEGAVSASFASGLSGFNVKRVAGSDRFGTNLEIMKEAGVAADQPVLIATAINFADSLSASAAGLPMVLVYGSLREDQKEFLATTSKEFIIIGGTSAVSEKLEAELRAIGNVSRLAGAGRYQTSVMVAQKFVQNPDAVVLAYARNFPDGLCGGPLAYALNAPLILTDNYDPTTADAYVEGITYGVVVGGTGLISDDSARAIFDLANSAPIAKK